MGIKPMKMGIYMFGPIPFRVPESSQFEALTPGPVSSVMLSMPPYNFLISSLDSFSSLSWLTVSSCYKNMTFFRKPIGLPFMKTEKCITWMITWSFPCLQNHIMIPIGFQLYHFVSLIPWCFYPWGFPTKLEDPPGCPNGTRHIWWHWRIYQSIYII
jgi:hypothetical protein